MITAPYNFVPLAKKVFFPEDNWADKVSHDVPFADGLSGRLTCKLDAISPIYIRNGGNWEQEEILSDPEAQSFFKVNDDFMIPGSSLRGMLRNVLEIASFGKMGKSRIDDNHYVVKNKKGKKETGKSVLEAVKNTSADHLAVKSDGEGKPDLADLLFGYVISNKNSLKDNLKSRVFIGHAEANKSTIREIDTVHTILASPKPTYYPNYIEQPEDSKDPYKTFMDEDCRIRGWKRYPARNILNEPTKPIKPKDGEPDKTSTKFKPLDAGAQFTFTIRFHNLKPCELGALIWALTWGGNEQLCHSLGMGKPFGYGQVRITMDQEMKLYDCCRKESNITFKKLQAEFTKLMTDNIKGWEISPQITQLLAMADPEHLKDLPAFKQQEKLSYMVLDMETGRNDFVTAKKEKQRLEPILDTKPELGNELNKLKAQFQKKGAVSYE